jgi:hypothetical protein
LHHFQNGKGNEEDRFCKVAAIPNLTARGIDPFSVIIRQNNNNLIFQEWILRIELSERKVALRFELRMGALQAPALPLGYATNFLRDYEEGEVIGSMPKIY